jgi:TM2 domain-containing membrane protein YozV
VSIVGEPIESDVLRVSTREREDAVKILGDHFSEGRLPVDEYEERVGVAVAAQTRGDLRPLFGDLPAPYPAFMVPPVRPVMPVAVPVFPPAYAIQPALPSDRHRVVAGVLQIFLPFGTGRFYTGHIGIALAQLFTAFIGIGVLWSMIDGLVLLVGGGNDADGRPLRI